MKSSSLRIVGVLFTVLLFFEAVCYSALFSFLSDNREVAGLLGHTSETKSELFKGTLDFLRNGGLSSVRNAVLILFAVCIVLRVLAAVLKADVRYLSTATVLIKGGVCILLVPFLLFHMLNDRTFAIEMTFLLVWAQLFAGLAVYITIALINIVKRILLNRK